MAFYIFHMFKITLELMIFRNVNFVSLIYDRCNNFNYFQHSVRNKQRQISKREKFLAFKFWDTKTKLLKVKMDPKHNITGRKKSSLIMIFFKKTYIMFFCKKYKRNKDEIKTSELSR